MYEVLGQMAALVACGVAWRMLRPPGLDADVARQTIAGLVYTLLLPALVLSVLWQAPLSLDVARIALAAAGGVLASLGMAAMAYRFWGISRRTAGALVLAAGFPNATYLGLPFLENVMGPWARSVAIQYDLFACTPLLLTVGILLAQRYGASSQPQVNPLMALLRVPPFWAAVAAVLLNVSGTPMPRWLGSLLQMMAGAVVPLMLIALGLGLRLSVMRMQSLPVMVPALVIQLLLMPLLVWGMASGLGLEGRVLIAVVMEAAMPSMVLGMVLCDRHGLDTGMYVSVVTLSTGLSLLSLPLWFAWLS
ncbi:MAG: transporter [Gammaproteobacteria bacterium RBG_16_57_12]|nr:MAG: transporter [Gammaproteobacteria bacterium RBG_16_57_12]